MQGPPDYAGHRGEALSQLTQPLRRKFLAVA